MSKQEFQPWKCHAQPAGAGGLSCGFQNATRSEYAGIEICGRCGCSKIASDLRKHDPKFDLAQHDHPAEEVQP